VIGLCNGDLSLLKLVEMTIGISGEAGLISSVFESSMDLMPSLLIRSSVVSIRLIDGTPFLGEGGLTCITGGLDNASDNGEDITSPLTIIDVLSRGELGLCKGILTCGTCPFNGLIIGVLIKGAELTGTSSLPFDEITL
jgi:hypothetical protein